MENIKIGDDLQKLSLVLLLYYFLLGKFRRGKTNLYRNALFRFFLKYNLRKGNNCICQESMALHLPLIHIPIIHSGTEHA